MSTGTTIGFSPGCPCCDPCPFCTGETMPQLQITMAGWITTSIGCTHECDSLNASFLLPFIGSTSTDPSNPSCTWQQTFQILGTCITPGFHATGITVITALLARVSPTQIKLDVVVRLSLTGTVTGGGTLNQTTILEWVKLYTADSIGACKDINEIGLPWKNGSDAPSGQPVCPWGDNITPNITCNVLAI